MSANTFPSEIAAAACLGWRLFPVEANGKLPLVKDWPTISTSDLEQLVAWAAQFPACNWGMATGKGSGVFVIDIDGPEGRAALEELARQGFTLPATRTVTTGREGGGEHRYYRMPDGVDIRNNNNGIIAPHIDVRGTGGYAVVPPSVHSSGKRYSFIDPDAPIADASAWLIERLTTRKPRAAAADGAIGQGTPISKGGRTNRLVSLAGTLHRRGETPETIAAALMAVNAQTCDPPLTEDKVRAIARDIPARYPNAPTVEVTGGLKLFELGEILSRPPEQVKWLLDGRLATGTLSMLASKPKCGKSTLARNLALAVARGESFLGAECLRGRVIYAGLEERKEDVAEDFRKLGATSTDEIQLIETATVPDLLGLLLEKRPALLVVDPLFRLVNVRDEKAYAEVYGAVGPLIDTARECGTHILTVHHSSKMAKADAIDSPIGSTALGGAVSTLVVMRRTEQYRTLETVQRLGDDLPETVLMFDPATKRLTLGGTREEADVRTIQARMLAALASGDCMTEPQLTEIVEGKTIYQRPALRGLVESGRITRTGTGKRGSPYVYQLARFVVPAPVINIGNNKVDVDRGSQSELDIDLGLQLKKVVPNINRYCGNVGTTNANAPKTSDKSAEMLVPEILGVSANAEAAGNNLPARRLPL